MSKHAGPEPCCFGLQFACGHSVECGADEDALRAHHRLHRADRLAWDFFAVALGLGVAVALAIHAGLIRITNP